jgi:hypothetical protein
VPFSPCKASVRYGGISTAVVNSTNDVISSEAPLLWFVFVPASRALCKTTRATLFAKVIVQSLLTKCGVSSSVRETIYLIVLPFNP